MFISSGRRDRRVGFMLLMEISRMKYNSEGFPVLDSDGCAARKWIRNL